MGHSKFGRNLVRIFSIAVISFSIFFNNSCKEEEKVEEPQPDSMNTELDTDTETTFFFIRHAEKDLSDYNNPDPELTQEGLGRAMRWANVFDMISLDRIYATNYQRTSMTAAPTSVKKNIDVIYFDPNELTIHDILKENIGKKILVVGHSNTTPAMVNELLGTSKYAEMQEDDHSSLYLVSVIGNVVSANRLMIE